MAWDTWWSRRPSGTQVLCQESGFRGSGVGSGTPLGSMGAPQLLYPDLTPLLVSYRCQRRGGGVATPCTIPNRHYLSGTGVRPVP